MKTRAFLPALQILRGFAALMVVFHHMWHQVSFFFSVDSTFLDGVAAAGKTGVDFFFVLSGFIICHAHMDKRGEPSAIREYALGRVLRIYLPYLPIGIGMLAAYHMYPGLSDANRDVSVLKSLTLLPGPGNPALSVAWTLVFEMFFYAVFVLFFMTRRWFGWIMGIWALLIVTGWGKNPFFFSTYNLEFMLGICGAFAYAGRLPVKRGVLAVVLLLVAVGLYWCPSILDDKLMRGAFFLSLLLLAADSPLNRIAPRNILMVIGNASYSIYLIHDPEISCWIRILPKHNGTAYISFICLLVSLSVCVTGILYSRVFEQSLLKRVKSLIRTPMGKPAGIRIAS
ncbi:MAG TPA: acyltransferase [Dinghuibacter sp.]|uniref:acyltransferase family protein n=1 Tax=Dinghuibacter sp. TaxID=2024697 RepID=UPI002CE19D9F|nr:acyltransferase [Dinghuibacter sp.]HTJ11216.1 acyltransferase [Dinghuibacter sp.]